LKTIALTITTITLIMMITHIRWNKNVFAAKHSTITKDNVEVKIGYPNVDFRVALHTCEVVRNICIYIYTYIYIYIYGNLHMV
jgi:hypothetical protein